MSTSEGTVVSAGPSPAVIFDTINSYQRTAALRTAVDLNLFTAVGDGQCTAAQLAGRCGASERGIRILADYLVVMELLTKVDGHYGHSDVSRLFLDHRSPACIDSTVRFLLDPMMMEAFDRLPEVVRSGHTALPGEGSVEENNPVWVKFAESMAPMMGTMAPAVAAAALKGGGTSCQVLDIAAGHGLFGIEIAKQNPSAHVTALDWPAVLDVASGNARKAGLDGRRYALLPGNAFKVPLGGPYDVALLTNFLHHFDKPTCIGLLRRLRESLAPGGRAVTLEFVPNEDRVSPPVPAAFALIMLADTVGGDAYTYAELNEMHREAGFAYTERQGITGMPQTIITGHLG